MPRQYAWQFRDEPGSDELLLAFSPAPRGLAFGQRKFSQNVLYLSDPVTSYYTLALGLTLPLIERFIESGGFTRVGGIGTSKAGFGALLWTGLLARRQPGLQFCALAFSPPTRIFPVDPEITWSSYRVLYARAVRSSIRTRAMERFGDLTFIEQLPNIFATIVFGERDTIAARHAARLYAPHIRKYPLALSFHTSFLPFIVDPEDSAALEPFVARFAEQVRLDPDLRGSVPRSTRALAKTLSGMGWLPNLRELVDECFMKAARR